MKPLGSLLLPICRQLGIHEMMKLESMKSRWHHLFDEPLSRHIYPVHLENGELVINVDSPGWLQQVQFYKQAIQDKLSEYTIKDIRFKYGKIYRRSVQGADSTVKRRQVPRTRSSRTLSDSETLWIDEVICPVVDLDLKETIRTALQKSILQSRRK